MSIFHIRHNHYLLIDKKQKIPLKYKLHFYQSVVEIYFLTRLKTLCLLELCILIMYCPDNN
jgi:hypothetical protein